MMVEQRVVKDHDGKVTGYREVSSLLYIERTKREVAERRSTREKLKQADKALEAWARWRLTSVGYGDSPLATMDNPRVPPKSTPPIGCKEAPELALAVIRAFGRMMDGDKVNRRYAFVLSNLYFYRKDKESIETAIKRLNLKVSMRQIRLAKEKLTSYM